MSFNTNPGRAEYTASTGQTVFPFVFKIFNDTDIKVYQTPIGNDPDDIEDLLILATDYTVTIDGDAGGQITLIAAANTGDAITLLRDLPVTREIEYQTSGDLLAETLNDDQEYQTYLLADNKGVSDRTLVFPESTQNMDNVLPVPEALKLLRWRSDEKAIENTVIADDGVFVNIFNINTIAELSTVNPDIYSTVNVRGYHSANDGGGGLFNYDVSQSAVNNGGTIINGWIRQYSGTISVKWFGVKGDGTTDDTINLQKLAIVASGNSAIGENGDVYKLTDSLICDFNFNLNGSKLLFELDGAIRCLRMRNNSSIFNGEIENNGINPSGAGQYQCPILVGAYGVGTGYQNVEIYDLDIITNRPNGNGIFVTGDSNNVKIKNINFPDSAFLGRGILIHWGNADDHTAGTKHPYNVEIENITGGIMTDTSVDGGLVFLSACYNVTINNTFIAGYKWESGHIVIYAGDYGKYYAPSDIKDFILEGIVITNAGGVATAIGSRCIKVDAVGTLAPVNEPLAAPTLIRCWGKGVGTGATRIGIQHANCRGGEVRDCKVIGYLQGTGTGVDVIGLKVIGGEYYDNESHGVAFNNSTTPPEDCSAIDVNSYANGAGGGNSAGVYIGNSKTCSAIRTRTGETSEATQDWGIRVDETAIDSIIENNYCKDATGNAFSIGSSTTYGICKSYQGNTSDATTIHSGMQPQIITTMQRGTNISRECLGGAAPTSGAWNRGDRVYIETPSAGGSMGWVCTTGGTPGTWKTFGTIAA